MINNRNIMFKFLKMSTQIYLMIIHIEDDDYSYRVGLNTLKHTSVKTEFYYIPPTSIANIKYDSQIHRLCVVTIPKDAKIMKNWSYSGSGFRSNKIIIEKIMYLWDIETIKYLLSIGVDVNILLVRSLEYIHLVEYLVFIGANIHFYENWAIQWASLEGHLDTVKYLVSLGANIRANDDLALRWAAREGHLNVVKYLVSVGSNIHANREYIVRMSSHNWHLDVVQYLVSMGARSLKMINNCDNY